MNNYLNILKFYFRKDLAKIILWTVIIFFLGVVVMSVLPNVFSDENVIAAMVQTLKSDAMLIVAGPVYGESPYSIAIFGAQELGIFIVLLAACMNVNFIITNTRSQEESGLIDLLVSLPIKKKTLNICLIIEMLIINLLIALVCFIGYSIINVEGMSLVGNLLFAIAPMLIGFVFASFSFFVAQLFNTSLASNALSYLLVAFFYILRGIFDVYNDNLSWLSPLSWINKMEIYYNNHFALPIFLSILISIIFIFLSLKIASKRDIGASLIEINKTNFKSSFLTRSFFSFVFRIERFNIIIWLVVTIVLSISYGAIMPSIASDYSSALTEGYFGEILNSGGQTSLVLNYMSLICMVSGIVIVIPLLITINHLHKEENNNRLENMIALPISRLKIYLSYLIIIFIFAITLVLLASFFLYVSALPGLSSDIDIFYFIRGVSNYLSAAFILISIACLLLAYLPKYIKLIYLYFGICFAILYFGKLIKVPEIINNLTIFNYISNDAFFNFDYLTFSIQIIIALILMFIAFIGYSKRDLNK